MSELRPKWAIILDSWLEELAEAEDNRAIAVE